MHILFPKPLPSPANAIRIFVRFSQSKKIGNRKEVKGKGEREGETDRGKGNADFKTNLRLVVGFCFSLSHIGFPLAFYPTQFGFQKCMGSVVCFCRGGSQPPE